VREERSRLEAKAERAAAGDGRTIPITASEEAPHRPKPTATSTAQSTHEAALRMMVARETRALERELRAEAQRDKLERKQQAARVCARTQT
jgi:hypothetical protein